MNSATVTYVVYFKTKMSLFFFKLFAKQFKKIDVLRRRSMPNNRKNMEQIWQCNKI